MTELPTGTVTFLCTDIQGSTKLWESHPDAMRVALARHDSILRDAIQRNGGSVYKTIGDAFWAAFRTAADCVNAALEAQLAFQAQAWGQIGALRVRMGIHSGTAEEQSSDYFGEAVNRTAQVQDVGHGMQTLLSQAAYELTLEQLPSGCSLKNLGAHRLKDLKRPEPIYQLVHPLLPADFPPLRSLGNPDLPNNLPQQVTSFVGREREMAEVRALLDQARLLTLTGSGGAGKTRLALQLAADVLDSYPDGVWFVELASLFDAALLPQAVADTLGVRESPGQQIAQTLISALKQKRLLLILDNCEHLVEASARLACVINETCPQVTVLASSREPLNIAGESVYRLPSLTVPPQNQSSTAASLSQFESARLFIDRATAVKSEFKVTDENAAALASICFRLDGIPLAIELAAARARALPLQEIDARLDQRFRLLTGGSRTSLPRQQTLRALIDWGYDLLEPRQKALLCRLSVFAGGWTLEMAEKICSDEQIDEWEVLDLLGSLVEKSLVVYDETEGHSRYRLLQTIRQYSAERLEDSGLADNIRERHRDYFLAASEDAGPRLSGPDQANWFRQLERDHDNVRAALDFSLLKPDPEKALRLCGAMWFFWRVRGYLSEGRAWCSRALSHGGVEAWPRERANVLDGSGILADYQSDFQAAMRYHEESLSIRQELEDNTGIASSLANLGNVYHIQGDYASARPLFEQSLHLRQKSGDKLAVASSLNNLGNVSKMLHDYDSARDYYGQSLALQREAGNWIGVAQLLNNLGNVALATNNYSAARENYEESATIRRRIGDRAGLGNPLHNLGDLAYGLGNHAAAREYWLESLAIFRELGDRWSIAYLLEDLAALTASTSGIDEAARLWGAAEMLREQIGAPLPTDELDEYLALVSAARERLGETAFRIAWTDGRAMTMERAIDLAMSGSYRT